MNTNILFCYTFSDLALPPFHRRKEQAIRDKTKLMEDELARCPLPTFCTRWAVIYVISDLANANGCIIKIKKIYQKNSLGPVPE